MAQLRDAQTSDLIAEGTPFEIVTIATEIGLAEVIFDDVGAIDPAAVLKAHDENEAGLDGAAAEADAQLAAGEGDRDETRERRDRLRAAADLCKADRKAAHAAVAGARQALEAARDRRREARRRER